MQNNILNVIIETNEKGVKIYQGNLNTING